MVNQGVRLLDADGVPYTLANPLPIQATLSSSNLRIATITAGNQAILSVGAAVTNPLPIELVTSTAQIMSLTASMDTITAQNQAILTVGAAVTNPLPISADNALNTAANPLFFQLVTSTADAMSLTASFDTITASNQAVNTLGGAITNALPVSRTNVTNSAINPIFTGIGASGGNLKTVTVYNLSATAVTVPAVVNLITRTYQNADGSITAFIGLTNAISPTATSANTELFPKAGMEDIFNGIEYLNCATGSSARVKVIEIIGS